MTRSAVGADLLDRPRAKMQVVAPSAHVYRDGCHHVGVCDDAATEHVDDDALSRNICHIYNHNADRSDVVVQSRNRHNASTDF